MSAPAIVHAASPVAPLELSFGDVGALLAVLAQRTGVDLTGQRVAMIARRAAQRISASAVPSAARGLEVVDRANRIFRVGAAGQGA